MTILDKFRLDNRDRDRDRPVLRAGRGVRALADAVATSRRCPLISAFDINPGGTLGPWRDWTDFGPYPTATRSGTWPPHR